MAERTRTYFLSDVHLGLRSGDRAEREERLVSFLKGLSREETKTVYFLGDIWDFWYEYKDVIPKEAIRVVAQMIDLMDAGVEVVFLPGNHDIWCYHFFEEIGVKVVREPLFVEIGGKNFCLAHGDGLGGAPFGYKLMLWVFHNRVLQCLFSTLHPTIAFRFGYGWSGENRKTHSPYVWKGDSEPLVKYANSVLESKKVDYFVFGHYHTAVQHEMSCGAKMFVLGDWISGKEPVLTCSCDPSSSSLDLSVSQ